MVKYRESGSQRQEIIFFLMDLQKGFRTILNQYQKIDKFKTLFNDSIVELSKIHGFIKVNKNGQYIFKSDDINILVAKKQEILSNNIILKLLNYGSSVTTPPPSITNNSVDDSEQLFTKLINSIGYFNGSIATINDLFTKNPYKSISHVMGLTGMYNTIKKSKRKEYVYYNSVPSQIKSMSYMLSIFDANDVTYNTLEEPTFIVNFLKKHNTNLENFVFRSGSIEIEFTEAYNHSSSGSANPTKTMYSAYPAKKETKFYKSNNWSTQRLESSNNIGISSYYQGSLCRISTSFEKYLINNDVKEFILELHSAAEQCIKSLEYIEAAIKYKGSEEIIIPKEIIDVFMF